MPVDANDRGRFERTNAEKLDAFELEAGTRVGRYILTRCLGAGGMGVVYCALDPELERKVALKFFTSQGVAKQTGASGETLGSMAAETGRQVLIAEARAAAKISHPNVVPVYDVGEHEGRVYVAMEFVEGSTLSELITNKVPQERILELLLQATRGLRAVHDAGLVHGDFKPDNLMVGLDGRVRLLDFGLAKSREQGARRGRLLGRVKAAPTGTMALVNTSAGTVFGGTPSYMAPELHDGRAGGALADQFALGVSMYEAVCRRKPFEAKKLVHLASLKGGVEHLTQRCFRRQAPWLRRIIAQALAADPQSRYSSLQALESELEAGLGRRSSRRVWLGASGFILAGGLSVLSLGALSEPSACEVGASEMINTWHHREREPTRVAMLATNSNLVSETFLRVDALMLEYSDRWKDSYNELCSAEPGSLLKRNYDARMQCLRNGQDDINHLIRGLQTAPEQLSEKAVDIANAAQDPAQCIAARLTDTPPLPSDPNQRAEVQRIKGQIDALETQIMTGDLKKVDETMMHVTQAAESLGYTPLLLDAYQIQGDVERSRWNFPAAIEAYEKAYWIAIRLGVPHRTMLLFNALQYVRDYSGWPSSYMEEQYQYGYALAERLGGTPELRVIAILTWALPYVNSDNGPKAEKLYREALAELNKGANVDGGRAARVYMNLGLALILQAKFEEGIQFNQIARERLSQIYGEAHPDLIFPLNNIGWALQELGRPAEALVYHEQAKKIIEDLSGPQSKRAGPAYHYRAMALAGLRRYEEARVAYSELAVLYRKTYGSRHFRTAVVLMEAARTALRSGRLTEAVALVDESKIATPDSADESFKGHVHAATTEIHAQVAIERGDVDGAEKILQASGILPVHEGPNEPLYPEVSRIWALLYVYRGDLERAIAAVEPWSTEHRTGRLNLRERPVRWTLVELLTRDGQYERARRELATLRADNQEVIESADALRPLGAAEAEWISLRIDVAEGIDEDPKAHDAWCTSAKFRLGRAAEIINRANHAAHRWIPLQLERVSVAIRCDDFELASKLLDDAQKYLEFGPEYTAQRTRLLALREELKAASTNN